MTYFQRRALQITLASIIFTAGIATGSIATSHAAAVNKFGQPKTTVHVVAYKFRDTTSLNDQQQAIAGSCSTLLLQLGSPNLEKNNFICPTHAQLLTGLNINAELIRSRLDRKPARSVMFITKTAWAG